MVSSDQQTEDHRTTGIRGIDWRGIVRTLLLQLVVLLALAGAAVGYINWSSDANWADFNAAAVSAAKDAKLHPATATSARTVFCARRA